MNKKGWLFLKSRSFLAIMALFVLVVIMAFFFGDSGIVPIIKTREEMARLNTRIAELRKERDRLAREVQGLDKDTLSLERKAREELWLMKKNEMVVVIVKKKKT